MLNNTESIAEAEVPLLTPKRRRPFFLARIFFLHVVPLLLQANKQPLENENIDDLAESDSASAIFDRFIIKFAQYRGEKYALYKSLFMAFKFQFILTYSLIFVYNLAVIYVPILINQCLNYLASDDQSIGQGCFWIGIILLVRMGSTLLNQNAMFLLRKMANDQYTAVSVFLMQKTLKVSFLSNKDVDSGKMINLMQVDATKIQTLNYNLALSIFIPLQLAMSIYLLFNFIGISFLAGFGVLLFTLGVNFWLGRVGWRNQKLVMTAKDARTKQANEIFQSIKFVKVNAYEDYFRNKLAELRKSEMHFIKKRLLISCCFVCSLHLSPQLILNATLAVYILLGENLTPANTFSIISLFQILQNTVQALPSSINAIVEANVSIKRLQDYFLTEELQLDLISNGGYHILEFKHCSLNWGGPEKQKEVESSKEEQGKKQKKARKAKKSDQVEKRQVEPLDESMISIRQTNVIQDLTLSVQAGEFLAIIGDVGSGKSSLIQAMLGEMLYEPGSSIVINGSIAYVSQKSWIQNTTLRNNILFGQPFDAPRYEEVLYYSCLNPDLQLLDHGDQTMIGEKGVNLSGGQKARIALARALYANADIYLLDDPISAVDAHVGKFIIEQCIGQYLKGKTILLVTHALQTCKYADRIVLLEGGQISSCGSFDEVMKTQQFQRVYNKFFDQSSKEEEQAQEEEESIKKSLSLSKQKSVQEKQKVVKDEVDNLMLLEERKRGEVSSEVLKEYFLINGGWLSFMMAILLTSLQTFGRYGAQIWLAKWSTTEGLTEEENIHYLEIFSLFSLNIGIFAFLRAFTVAKECVKTAITIHNRMIDALIRAPLCEFFERVPIGVLMNRLTKDQAVLDMEIYYILSVIYVNVFNVLATTFMNIYSSTIFILLPAIVFFYSIYRLQRFYMKANRELYRLESISKSPILSLFSETVLGLTLIRAFQKQENFVQQHLTNIDLNRKIILSQMAVGIWFQMTLTFMSYIVNISAIVYTFFIGSKDPALAGILMTIATNIDVCLQNMINNSGQLETQFISFERCLAFTKVQHERGVALTEHVENWPVDGQISFDKLVVKYRENLSPALRGLTVQIKSREKIGVVGRTGAGKSTITLALLRILEASEGRILIDGVPLDSLSLKQLRESITMILQDAVMFQGTIRENLDPLHQHTDEEVIAAGNLCCLQNLLASKDGLNLVIKENGDNLSAGERQLIAIARAVLKRSKIVLIDEATANIDIDTEQKIQNTIRQAFENCTVVTIAHRINTIMGSDKILVIDQGEAKEFAPPSVLLADPDSQFSKLYQEASNKSKSK